MTPSTHPRFPVRHHHRVAPRDTRKPEHDRGYVLVWFTLLLVTLFSFAGFAVDVASLWFTTQKIQKAADAAALAGAVYMPADLSGATAEAEKVAAMNGFADGVSGYTTNATVNVTQQPNPYRLKVEITHTAKTYFAALMGVKNVTLDRYAIGEYQGPVPMGSPTNNIGNQPGTSPWVASNPVTTANTNPQVWANTAAPNTDKANGDRYATQYCSDTVNTHNCVNNVNTEYQSSGYFYVVKAKVTASDLSKYLAVQVYDPAFVQQGDTCNDFDGDGTSAYNSNGSVADNDEVNIRNEMVALNNDRYRAPSPYNTNTFNSTYCPGDNYIRSGYSNNLPTTTYTMRKPDTTPWNNLDNPAITTTGCKSQSLAPIRGRNSSDPLRLSQLLNPSSSATGASYARSVYHNWDTICNVTLASLGITTAGEYDFLLQVSTAGGAGHNRYAIRAGLDVNGGLVSPDGSKVSIYANGKLPLYANASGADSRFYLARLLPGNAGRTLSIQFFDVGDAGDIGSIQILPPAEATVNGSAITTFSNCTFTRLPTGGTALSPTGSTCTLGSVNSSNGYNGRTVIANVPIPSGYSCNANSSFGCWVQVKFAYPSGVSVTDTTTWSANILGDPVRLVE